MATSPLRNVWLKFLSIGIATLLWLIVAGDRVVERAVRAPIEFQSLPQGLEIVGNPPEDVDVRLRAPSGKLARLVPGDVTAVIDLRSARSGRRLFHLTPANVQVPYGVEVVQVSPATLPIGFESSAVRIVQVRPSIEGSPAAGFEVTKVTSEPATVEIVGPESSLRGLDEAMTEPISIAGATQPVREVVTIGVADPAVRLRTPQTAEVRVFIVSGSATKTIGAVAVQLRNLDDRLRGRLVPGGVAVTVRGTAAAVAASSSGDVEAYVDAAGLAAGDHDMEVRTRIAQGLTIENVSPARLRLRLSKP